MRLTSLFVAASLFSVAACKTTGSQDSGLREGDSWGGAGGGGDWGEPVDSGNADYVRLYIYPSTWGFTWGNPSGLVRWLVANAAVDRLLSPHNIGHADIEVFCKAPNHNGQETHFYAGQTGGFEMGKAIAAGEGLGVLAYSYSGKLYSPQETKDGIEAAAKSSEFWDPKHDLGFITAKIRPDTCNRLATYFKEYQERNYQMQYGSRNRPRYGEGAGCTAFGVSFMELAGVLNPGDYEDWKTHIRVPQRWIGAPGQFGENNIDDFRGMGGKMPLKELAHIIDPRSRWAAPNEPGVDIHLYDPDKIYAWIQRNIDRLNRNPALGTTFNNGNFKGVEFDFRDVPTPTEPIWLGKAAEGYIYQKPQR